MVLVCRMAQVCVPHMWQSRLRAGDLVLAASGFRLPIHGDTSDSLGRLGSCPVKLSQRGAWYDAAAHEHIAMDLCWNAADSSVLIAVAIAGTCLEAGAGIARSTRFGRAAGQRQWICRLWLVLLVVQH